MSPFRPDIVECWVYRLGKAGAIEYLLIRRAPGRIFPGLWQCVTGRLDPDEQAPIAALREVSEETGFGPEEIEGFFDLDDVAQFYAEDLEAVVSSMIFAVRVRAEASPRLSVEHDGFRWADQDEAVRTAVWPAYREALERIEGIAADPEHARWFELDLDGHRIAR